jgi:hypothetical protein
MKVMSTLLKSSAFLFFILLGVVFASMSCEKEEVAPLSEEIEVVGEEGTISMASSELCKQLDTIAKQAVEDSEVNSLHFIREEEKLAHDVYSVFYQKYEQRIFNNISSSESTHYNAVGCLLERYELSDPSEGNELGVFTNETLQELFDDLIARGNANLEEALKVGALIEEVDIKDIQDDMVENIDNEDIELIYSNLMRGSRNHLRAFVSQLKNIGVSYEPVVLSPDQYQSIIDSPMEHGSGH